jgi:hypothetical protein
MYAKNEKYSGTRRGERKKMRKNEKKVNVLKIMNYLFEKKLPEITEIIFSRRLKAIFTSIFKK